MTYRAPVADIAFALKHAAGLKAALGRGPLRRSRRADDRQRAGGGRPFRHRRHRAAQPRRRQATARRSRTARSPPPPGWKDAYQRWAAAGWNGLAAPARLRRPGPAAGGQRRLHRNVELGVDGVRPRPAADAWRRSTRCDAHGSDELKQSYLRKLVSGEWTGTMQLTEPQAGSDVGALRTRAERAADGSYRITGQKIFITYGEHDLTDNIIHFVLARLPDAPPGTKGISLFLVPKFLVNADGSLGARNDVRAHSVEHKLGIHASPTCTMVYGDNGGADRLPGRRGKPRHGLHVHDDEPGAARRRPAGRRHRRARDAAGAGLCAASASRAAPSARRRHRSDHRASRRQAHAAAPCAR